MVQEITKIRFWIICNPFYILLCWPRVSLCCSLWYEGNFAGLVRAVSLQVSVGAGVRSLCRSASRSWSAVCRLRATRVCVEAQDDADGTRQVLRRRNKSSLTATWHKDRVCRFFITAAVCSLERAHVPSLHMLTHLILSRTCCALHNVQPRVMWPQLLSDLCFQPDVCIMWSELHTETKPDPWQPSRDRQTIRPNIQLFSDYWLD